MNAARTVFEDIIIIDDNVKPDNLISLKNYYGILPDFPERGYQGEFEKRDII